MIKTILFDLDDTILDFKKAEAIALSGTLRELNIAPSEERIALYSDINAAQWRRLEAGELTRTEVLTTRFRIFFDAIGEQRLPEQAQALYEARLSQGHYFIDGAIKTLETLSSGYALYLVSNGNLRVQEGRLRSAAISHFFRDIFISEQIGADKPSPLFFDRCFARIDGFERSAAIIVGDSLTSDIRGGLEAGIHTCWFNPRRLQRDPAIPAEYEITNLRDLIPLVQAIV